jgi:CRP/FNR family cyclic AMP-dependent transcriptional regulator
MMNPLSDDTQNLLSTVPLFKGLSKSELGWVSQRVRRRVFPALMNILLAEQPGEAVYIILFGTVKIYIEQADDRDVVLSIIGAGDTLGEISLLDSAGHSASAITLEDSLLLWMDKETFEKILDDFPVVAKNLVRILSARLRMNNELISALATLNVYGRVARQLLAFADKYGAYHDGSSVLIPISLKQSDIADLVGASRKRVNQVMVAFRESELISLNTAGKIIVLNRAGLAEHCR